MRRTITAVAGSLLCCLLPTQLGIRGLPQIRKPVASVRQYPVLVPESSVAVPSINAAEIALSAAIDKCATRMTVADRERLVQTVLKESKRHGYDPLFVQALLETESQCDPHALGVRGAIGLIQIRPTTARAVAADVGVPWSGPAMLRNSAMNVRLGLHYLSQLEDRFSDPYLALAAYNLGPTRVARLPKAKARRSIYVRKVLARYHSLLTGDLPRVL